MKLKLCVFSSGSDGNSSLLESDNGKILIDVGLTRKAICENLEKSATDMSEIDAIFITHEHIDHVKGLLVILKKDNIKTYMTKGTFEALKGCSFVRNNPDNIKLLEEKKKEGIIKIIKRDENGFYYEAINVKDFYVIPIPTFHDALESVGFIFINNMKRFVYITDTGYVHNALFNLIENADAYLLESNHDPEILLSSDRPYNLKMRILSDHGHLSNLDSMLTLAKTIGENTKLIMHAHISQECNLTQIIELERDKVFKEYEIDTKDIDFVILRPFRSKEYEI